MQGPSDAGHGGLVDGGLLGQGRLGQGWHDGHDGHEFGGKMATGVLYRCVCRTPGTGLPVLDGGPTEALLGLDGLLVDGVHAGPRSAWHGSTTLSWHHHSRACTHRHHYHNHHGHPISAPGDHHGSGLHQDMAWEPTPLSRSIRHDLHHGRPAGPAHHSPVLFDGGDGHDSDAGDVGAGLPNANKAWHSCTTPC